jgi:hypothetical protein
VQAAGHRIEREQEHDEAQIIGERDVHEGAERGLRAEREGERQQRRERPAGGDLAVVLVPDTPKQQRSGRDRQQDANERKRPAPADLRAVERWRGLGSGGVQHGSGRCDAKCPGKFHPPRVTGDLLSINAAMAAP